MAELSSDLLADPAAVAEDSLVGAVEDFVLVAVAIAVAIAVAVAVAGSAVGSGVSVEGWIVAEVRIVEDAAGDRMLVVAVAVVVVAVVVVVVVVVVVEVFPETVVGESARMLVVNWHSAFRA